MRTRYLYALGFVALAAPMVPACDSVTAGQLQDDPGPPVLMKILIQDQEVSGGRQWATDLLNLKEPVACSDTNPCPAGDDWTSPHCEIEEGKTDGFCPNPFSPNETPPQIGRPQAGTDTSDNVRKTLGGLQIRIVFSKILDLAVEEAKRDMASPNIVTYALKDPALFDLVDWKGESVPAVKHYSPSGSPTLTSNPFAIPYGPALVIKPRIQLAPGSEYTVKLKVADIKDKKGQAPAKDVNGKPVVAEYKFKTEGFRPSAAPKPAYTAVAPNQFIQIIGNQPFAVETLTNANVTVTDMAGNTVTTQVEGEWTYKMGGMPLCSRKALTTAEKLAAAMCATAGKCTARINIARVSKSGTAVDWDPGEYTLTVKAGAAGNPASTLKMLGDVFGTKDYVAKFTVKGDKVDAKDANALANLVLPDSDLCNPPPPPMPDMASAGDGGM